jgi:hypothetical protein
MGSHIRGAQHCWYTITVISLAGITLQARTLTSWYSNHTHLSRLHHLIPAAWCLCMALHKYLQCVIEKWPHRNTKMLTMSYIRQNHFEQGIMLTMMSWTTKAIMTQIIHLILPVIGIVFWHVGWQSAIMLLQAGAPMSQGLSSSLIVCFTSKSYIRAAPGIKSWSGIF